MSQKALKDMTDEQFERYLKRNKLTGMAAVAMTMKRRRQLGEIPPADPQETEDAS